MSNLWPHERAGAAASVGSFAIERAVPMFTPWASRVDGPAAGPEGRVDFEAMRAQAFAEGFDQGRESAEIEFAEQREAIAKLVQSIDLLQPEPTNALALLLAEAVDRLVRQIVGQVEIDGATLMARAEAAAALIGSETEPSCLRLHPEDVPLLDGAYIPVELVGDPNLQRGSLVLETGAGWIEDGPAVRLDRLRAELDRMGAPL